MIIADSNLIIYAASKKYPALMDWFAENKPATSAISLVETLGYHNLRDEEKRALAAFFAELTIYYPTPEVFQTAIDTSTGSVTTCANSAPCRLVTRSLQQRQFITA